ncbi:MAG: PH domain-containing protein [Fimbriimonadaceae bacterium]
MGDRIDISSWKKLEPKVQTLWRVTNGIMSLVLACLAIIPDLILRKEAGKWPLFPFALPLIAFVIIGILTQWIVGRSYQCYRYELGEDDLAVAKGVFWKSWRFVNRNRIQHVDLTSGPIARALGLVEVSIFVGGMHTAAVTIPGLSMSDGEKLRSTLVRAGDAPSLMMHPTEDLSEPPLQSWEPPNE